MISPRLHQLLSVNRKGLQSSRGLGLLFVLEHLNVMTAMGGDMRVPQPLLLVRWRVISLMKEKTNAQRQRGL